MKNYYYKGKINYYYYIPYARKSLSSLKDHETRWVYIANCFIS